MKAGISSRYLKKNKMPKLKLYAIVAQLEKPGQWNLVGIFDPKMGHMAAVNTKRSVIEQMYNLIAPEVKDKGGAKIITLTETEA